MKMKLLVAAAATVLASSAMAQSAFEGFYGQIGTGYESNNASSLNTTGTNVSPPNDAWNVSNQSFGGVPAVVGLGYNFSVAPQWLIGIGADYSAINQKSSNFNYTSGGASTNGSATYGSSLQTSNRFNIFVTPGYAIDKDKLVYLKAGYSSVSLKQNFPSSYTNAPGQTPIPYSTPSQTNTLSGYVVGLGYKQMIANGFYGFGEANYMSYSSASFTSSAGTGNNKYVLSNSPSLSSYQLLGGVGYKF